MASSWSEMAVVGRIARAHGTRGQVIVNPETDFPHERFQPGSELFVERGGRLEVLTLTSVRFQHERPVIGIGGIDSMNDAEALAGCELRVPIALLAPLPQDMYYRHDLIGCRVETSAGAVVGLVKEVDGALHGGWLVVTGTRGEVLIPLASPICTSIDIAGKRIVVEPPEGLLDVNA